MTGDVAAALAASDFDVDGELADALGRLLGDGERAAASKPAGRTQVTTTTPTTDLLRRLISWYDTEDGDDDELERIVTAARYEVRRRI